jgi:hypothetical protein
VDRIGIHDAVFASWFPFETDNPSQHKDQRILLARVRVE